MIYVIYGIMGLSLLFAIAGVIGMLRMPDTYCRMHSATIISTIVVILLIAGAIVYTAVYIKNTDMIIKLAVMMVFYVVTSPIPSRALAKGIYREGCKLTAKNACDHYGEDLEEC